MISSDLLFRSVDLSAVSIQSFSDRHKLQHDRFRLYGTAYFIMDHLIEQSVPLSFRSQMYLIGRCHASVCDA